jgi:hypothetical protein
LGDGKASMHVPSIFRSRAGRLFGKKAIHIPFSKELEPGKKKDSGDVKTGRSCVNSAAHSGRFSQPETAHSFPAGNKIVLSFSENHL